MRPSLDHRQNARAAAPPTAPRPSRILAAAMGVALTAALSGCTGPATPIVEPDSGEPATPSAPASLDNGKASAQAATPAGASSPGPDAAATETTRQTIVDTLTRLAAETPKPATAQVTDALTGAGLEPAALEVSQSRTPTGLEADAIEAAMLQGRDCIIGQVREGTVTVTVLPVLASGKCFVGS